MNQDRKALFERVAERLVEQLEKGTSPFHKPWTNVNDFEMPYNPTTGKDYRGMNSIWLMMQGYADPRWLTFKQAKANDWNVEKGSRGSLINYVKLYDERIKRDEKGKPILDGKDNPLKMRVKLDRPIITSAIDPTAANRGRKPAVGRPEDGGETGEKLRSSPAARWKFSLL